MYLAGVELLLFGRDEHVICRVQVLVARNFGVARAWRGREPVAEHQPQG